VPPRRLLLIRHAQAADAPIDAERPLTDRGVRAAGAIGSWLRETGVLPDRVLVSPARRAVQTWEKAGAALAAGPDPVVDARIYANTVEHVLAAIREAPEGVRALAVVGHNPSLGQLTEILDDGHGDPRARDALGAGFRTGGVAVFVVDAPLEAIAPGAARLTAFAVPGN